MNLSEFTTRVIDEGIEAAKADYNKPENAHELEGAIEGFERCRGKSPDEIRKLLQEAADNTAVARNDYHSEPDREEDLLKNYWKVRCTESEIEWVANVVSAVLMNENLPVIIPPTARGVLKANEILSKEAA